MVLNIFCFILVKFILNIVHYQFCIKICKSVPEIALNGSCVSFFIVYLFIIFIESFDLLYYFCLVN